MICFQRELSSIPTMHITKGGVIGYLLRRITHVASILIPVCYYNFDGLFKPIAHFINVEQLILAVLIIMMMLESLRLRHSWKLIGQRNYETYSLSGFVWSLCGSFLVVLTLKQPGLAFAIIVSYSMGDPLMGEMRRAHFRPTTVIVIALSVITIIWLIFMSYYNLPLWFAFIMPALSIAAEWPKLSWIDDNALMQLVPLVVVWLMGV